MPAADGRRLCPVVQWAERRTSPPRAQAPILSRISPETQRPLLRFTRAAELGEIDADQASNYAHTMLSITLGMSVIVRGGASDDEIRAQLDSARSVLEGWRIDR